jgi:2-iminobutanoate/2-iminopropanoate deaminase
LFHESPYLPQGESNLIATRISRIASLIAAAAILTACGTSTGGFGLPWIKQGPGNTPEEARADREAKARSDVPAAQAPQPARAPQPAPSAAQAPVNSRQIEVAPELVAQSPPPPRTPAQAAAASAGSAASYTQGTRYGDLVFVSGQIALDYGTGQLRGTTVEEQTRQAMENVRGVLESHRLTFANVVSVTVYLKELNDFRGMNTAYESFFRGALPARSVVAVSRLPRDALVEIAVIAGR